LPVVLIAVPVVIVTVLAGSSSNLYSSKASL